MASSWEPVQAVSTRGVRDCVFNRCRSTGASPSSTCALAPPKPNELTPATAGAGLRPAMALRRDDPQPTASKSMVGFGVLEVQRRRESRDGFTHSAALMRPATPAAASRWPMLDFTDPIAQESTGQRALAKDRAQTPPPRSDRRPPSPCRALPCTARRTRTAPRLPSASRTIASCAARARHGQPRGRPSSLIAVPTITAYTGIADRQARARAA